MRPMTTEEIRKALRHSADVCIEKNPVWWWSIDVISADGAFAVAESFAPDSSDSWDAPALHAALFLGLCAEALE